MPLFTVADQKALAELASEFEIDFLALAFTRGEEDIAAARELLAAVGTPGTQACIDRF